MIGIYKITSPSGKVYIGQSVNIKKRFTQYRNNLAKGQRALNSSFLKHGIEKHVFEIIEQCEVSELNNRERYYQEYYNAMGKKGLNLCLTETYCKRKVVSDLFLEKLKENNKNRVWTKESRDKLADKVKKRMIGNSFKKGFKHDECFKEKRRVIMLGNKNTLGYKHNQESREKMSKNSGATKIVLDTQTGVFYNSLIEVSKLYGIKSNTLGMKLSGYNKNNTQFIYA